MHTKEKLAELESLQAKGEAIRLELGISAPGQITFLAPYGAAGCEAVVVTANGFGGATASVIDGNYPVDYVTKFAKSFPSEQQAAEAATQVAFAGLAPSRVLLAQ